MSKKKDTTAGNTGKPVEGNAIETIKVDNAPPTPKVVYTWGEEQGTEVVIRNHILNYIVNEMNNRKLGEIIGNDGSIRTFRLTIELNPPIFPARNNDTPI